MLSSCEICPVLGRRHPLAIMVRSACPPKRKDRGTISHGGSLRRGSLNSMSKRSASRELLIFGNTKALGSLVRLYLPCARHTAPPPAACLYLPLPAFTCLYLSLPAFTCPYLPLPATCLYLLLHAFTCLHLPLPAFTCVYQPLPACTCLYLPLPAFTSFYLPLLPAFTCL